MIGLYRFVTGAVYRVVYPYYRLRATSGKELWKGRLGLIPDVGPKDIWIHAASVGETRVIRYLVNYLLTHETGIKIHVTVMTQTGFRTAVKIFPPNVTVSFFPLDAMSSVVRSLDRIRPRCIVIAETEIWPNLIGAAAERQIPVILVNGRMSDNSFRRYRRVAGSLGKLLSLYDRFFFKTAEDRERFGFFGVDESSSVVSGDMKFDAPLDERSEGRIAELRHRMGIAEIGFLVVAGSTRPGEEKQLLSAYRSLKKEHPRLRLLLAPRHIERTGEIATLLKGLNEPYIMHGSERTSEGVILVDKMGILNELYMAADVAFVGGTLVDIGGHNLLEPVWAGTPVLFGPHVGNVREAAEYIIEHHYGAGVASIDKLAQTLVAMLDKRLSFETKNESDLKQAATSIAGNYILEKLGYV